jgi:hypothetical protein
VIIGTILMAVFPQIILILPNLMYWWNDFPVGKKSSQKKH